MNKVIRSRFSTPHLTIFQTMHNVPIQICNVDDCITASKDLSNISKRIYFDSCCVNYDNVEKYYDTVISLNKAYYGEPLYERVMSFVYTQIGLLFSRYLVINDFTI